MRTKIGYTVREVAGMLRLQEQAVYRHIERGNIPTVRLGRKILVPHWFVEQFLVGPSGNGKNDSTPAGEDQPRSSGLL